MLIELSTLPPMIAEQILTVQQGNTVAFAQNGKVVATVKPNHQPSYAKGDFDYDLERMKKAVEAPYVVMPKGMADDPEKFIEWLKGAFK